MIQDPHYMPYGSMNLNSEHWCELEKNEKLLKLVEQVKSIFDQELVAIINNSVLDEIAFEATWNTELDSEFVNQEFYNGHYAGYVICLLTHGAMEHFNKDMTYPWQRHYEQTGKTRFSKSPHDNEAYLPENTITVLERNVRWGKTVLKSSLLKPAIPVVEQPQQFSLFG